MSDTRQARLNLLRQFYNNIKVNCESGAFLGVPFTIRANSICGPRAGALELKAGGHSGPLMQKLAQHDSALLRQLIPDGWDFPGNPSSFMRGRYVRLEAGWPTHLAETIVRLDELGRCPGDKHDRWTVGINEHGIRSTTSLSNITPHFLFAGATGSGKTVAARNAALQLSDGHNEMILCDGKMGESLHVAEHWRGVVGPLATEIETVRNALGWAHTQMVERYRQVRQGRMPDSAIVIVFDEFQAFTEDNAISALMREIATQGRAARVHLLAMTQQPGLAIFGNDARSRMATRRQMSGRIALQVTDSDASRVVVGQSMPRADHLFGAGDAYLLAPGSVVQRIQCAYVDEKNFDAAPTGEWQFDEWPTFDVSAIGMEPDTFSDSWDATESAIGILTAAQGNRGRPTMLALFDEYEHARPGADRARRLLEHGRDVWDVLQDSPELAQYCAGRLTG